MSEKKIKAPHWRVKYKSTTSVKPIKGCMQDPIIPIEFINEIEDWRFNGIVSPEIGTMHVLCKSVKDTPGVGFCNETPQGFSGKANFVSKKHDKETDLTVTEAYTWDVRQVPCK